MKKTLKTLLAAAALASVVSSANAISIDGTIAFVGSVELYDAGGDPVTLANADGVSVWTSLAHPGFATVESADGDFSGLAGSAADMAAPWAFNSGALADFWTVGAFSFDLISSGIDFQSNGAIVVSGVGTIKSAGYDDTRGTWDFTMQGSQSQSGTFSFSAGSSSVVPDSGSTMALLGLGILGVAGVARRMRK